MSKSIANIEVDENKFNSTNETENLHLPQFVATDKPGWLTDFNGAMEVIDEAAGVLQDQITEQFEDLESVHTQLNRVDDDINNPEHGLKQLHADNSNRISRLETTVGNESHGLVKDVNELQDDMVQTNTMAVKDNATLGSVVNLLCNKFVTTAQYNPGAYVYTENDDGSLNFLRCTTLHHGAFNPDHFEDVTEKLISALDNSGGGGGSQYVLPVAGDADDPDAVLGGVIVGEGLSIDPETGILSRTVTPTEGIGSDYYASRVRAGLVKPNTDAGLDVNSSNGVISIIIDDNTMVFTPDGKLAAKPDTSRFASGQGINISNEAVPHVSVKLAANGNLGFDSDGGLRAILPDSAYTIVQGSGVEIVTDAQNNTKTINIKQASPNELGGIMTTPDEFYIEHTDEDHPNNVEGRLHLQLYENKGLKKQSGQGFYVGVDGTTVTYDQNGNLQATGGGGQPYVLPIASDSTLGGVKVGTGLEINSSTGMLRTKVAGSDALGGIKVGDGLSIESDGTLSVSGGGGGVSDVHFIQDYYDFDTGFYNTYIHNTISSLLDKTGGRMLPVVLHCGKFVQGEWKTLDMINPLGITPPDPRALSTDIYIRKGTPVVQLCGSFPCGHLAGQQIPGTLPPERYGYFATSYGSTSMQIGVLKEDVSLLKLYYFVTVDDILVGDVWDMTNPASPTVIEDVFLDDKLVRQTGSFGFGAVAQNLVGEDGAIIPCKNINMYGNPYFASSFNDPTIKHPIVETQLNVIDIPEESRYKPLTLFLPMYFRPSQGFKSYYSSVWSDIWDTTGGAPPLKGYSAEITYRVDIASNDNLDTRHTVFEKTFRIRRSMWEGWNNGDRDYVPVRDYTYGDITVGHDPQEYRYLSADIYPSDASKIIVTASIVIENEDTGSVRTTFSEYYNDATHKDFELGWVELATVDQEGNPLPSDYGTPSDPGSARSATLNYYLYETDNY